MSDLGVEEGAPGGKLSHPTVKRGGYPLPAQPHPITERRTFQGSSLLQRRPELCSSIPSSAPAGCGLPFSGPQPPLLERQEASN